MTGRPTTAQRNASGSAGYGTQHRGPRRERRALGAMIKLLRAAHWVSHEVGRSRAEAGLTETQFGVLEALFHTGPHVQSALASKLLSSPSNLTLVIDNLERDRLVARTRSVEDRRCQVVQLTPQGRRMVERVFPQHARRVGDVFSVLTAAEQDELARLCRKLGRAAQTHSRS